MRRNGSPRGGAPPESSRGGEQQGQGRNTQEIMQQKLQEEKNELIDSDEEEEVVYVGNGKRKTRERVMMKENHHKETTKTRILRERPNIRKNYAVDLDDDDEDDEEEDSQDEPKRRKIVHKKENQLKSSRNEKKIIELIDTDEEHNEAMEQSAQEEDDESEYEGGNENVPKIPPPKPFSRVLKKSWKTVDSENSQPGNAFEKFGFVVTDKNTALAQMSTSMPKTNSTSSRQSKKAKDIDEGTSESEVEEMISKRTRRGPKKKMKGVDSLTNLGAKEKISSRIRSRSDRQTSQSVNYAELPSGDEDLLLSEEEAPAKNPRSRRNLSPKDSDVPTTRSKSKNEGKTTRFDQQSEEQSSEASVEDVSGGEESDPSNEAASDDFQYRIEHVLGTKKLTAEEWRKICDNMTTREITKGSVLQQPDEEYYSNSPELVEKFLIKWSHCSYLHVSWETRSDLESLCGRFAKPALNRFFLNQLRGKATLFDDLRSDEYFPPNVLMIDRVLDVDDDTINIQTIDWQSALLPKNPYIETDDDQADDPSAPYLHSNKCFLTVKWENLPYCDCTFEDINDLRKHGVEYESCLREFYRREQFPPAKNSRRIVKRKIEPSVMQQPPSFQVGELRDYQWDGVRWLLYNWSNKRNSILADEMGLGKTIQTAAFFQILSQHQGLRGPFLVVAPLSTLVNWQREMNAWTNLDCIIYQGSLEDRKLIREHEFYYMTRPKTDGFKIQIVVTSPEACLAHDGTQRNSRLLSKIHWDMLIIDEAHKIKNHASKISSALRQEFSYSNCILLTGTPLQNNTEELWTLLNFIEPVQFESREAFLSQFGDLKESSQLEQLHQRISPYLLRRVKENVEKSVPPKEEIIIEVELTIPQKQYYRALYERNKAFLFRNGSLKEGPRLTNLAMELRKCCNHPYLVRGAEAELKSYFSEQSKDADVLTAPTPYQHDLLYALVQSSGKFVLLDKLLPKLAADGHRVLIFSQFRIMLDLIEDYLHLRRFTYDRIDGSITGRKRQAAIDKFCQPGSPLFIMLLSTRAGGVGINLTPADTVIIYDSDWNPQNDIQAQARAHRIGQTKSVKVYRLLTKKSYEMRMFEIASKKLGLDYAIMHNIKGTHPSHAKASANNATLTSKEVELLLRQGAYDIFREDKDGSGDLESKKFCEEDIDQILSRSTIIVHDDQQKQHPTANFSKASFIQNGSQSNVDVNDPDFWSKVVGLSLVEEAEENTRHRKCKTVTNYTKGKVEDDSDSDQNFSLNEEDPAPRPKKVKAKKSDLNVIVPAEWNRLNLSTLFNAFSICGYFNWSRIKTLSKLPFSISDIASGCRMLILILFRMSCLTDDTNTPVDRREYALQQFNESKFYRFVFLAYQRELQRRNIPPISISIEDEILKSYYHNIQNGGVDYMTKFSISDSRFHELCQLSYSVPVDPEFFNMLVSDIKSRNAMKTKLSHLEDHFEIAHAIMIEELHNQEKLLSDRFAERYPGFDPTQSSLLYFLSSKLIVEDSPAEWWVTGPDDYLMMKEVSLFGFPHTQQRILVLENYMMEQNPGPKHREKVSADVEFLIGGSGYLGKVDGTELEHLEKGEIHRRLKDIICLLRNQEMTIHFSGYLLKAIALYGWPTDTISALSEKYQQRDPETLTRVLRPEYLPNWLDLAKITGCKIVRKEKIMECCHSLTSVPSTCKSTLTASSIQKSTWINTIKIFLSLHDDNWILRIFEAGVPYGASCTTAPIWWTAAHDIKFLKLVVKYGSHWKAILEDPEAGKHPNSLQQPEPTFVVPQYISKCIMLMDKVLLQQRFQVLMAALQPKKSSSGLAYTSKSSTASKLEDKKDPPSSSSSPSMVKKSQTIPTNSASTTCSAPTQGKEILDLTDSAVPSNSAAYLTPSSVAQPSTPQSSSSPSSAVKNGGQSSSASKPSPGANGRSIMSFFRKA